jgi:hypothetical protein
VRETPTGPAKPPSSSAGAVAAVLSMRWRVLAGTVIGSHGDRTSREANDQENTPNRGHRCIDGIGAIRKHRAGSRGLRHACTPLPTGGRRKGQRCVLLRDGYALSAIPALLATPCARWRVTLALRFRGASGGCRLATCKRAASDPTGVGTPAPMTDTDSRAGKVRAHKWLGDERELMEAHTMLITGNCVDLRACPKPTGNSA